MNKSEFIRQHATRAVQDVVALAKRAGLPITADYVSMVRARDVRKAQVAEARAKQKAREARTSARVARTSPAPQTSPPVALATHPMVTHPLRAIMSQKRISDVAQMAILQRVNHMTDEAILQACRVYDLPATLERIRTLRAEWAGASPLMRMQLEVAGAEKVLLQGYTATYGVETMGRLLDDYARKHGLV